MPSLFLPTRFWRPRRSSRRESYVPETSITVGRKEPCARICSPPFSRLNSQKYTASYRVKLWIDNRAGPQLDVLIYDQSRNFPFISNASVVLPAEALLASIEVKSKLNSAGIASSIEAVRRLRSLRPFKKELAGRNVGNAASSEPRARYFHSIFAYETDLSDENWAKKEYLRFIRGQLAQEHTIDVVYVLGRGVINLSERKFVLEDEFNRSCSLHFLFWYLEFS